MGFRMSKSFKVAPGVRMTVSRSGVGYSVGGKGVRVTKRARGGVTTTVRVPGTGLSYTTSSGSGRSRTPAGRTGQLPATRPPGMFAAKPEKELYKALARKDYPRIAQLAGQYPAWAPLCATLDGLMAYQEKAFDRAERALWTSFQSGQDAATHPFMQRYFRASTVELEVADGVTVSMPVGREAVGLALAELLQGTGRVVEAIGVVEALEPTFSAALSLAELYGEAGRYDEVIAMTNNISNETDAHAFLLVQRARAMREMDMVDGAREALKEALRRRSVDPEIRRRAYFERANTYLAQGRRSQARKDLERVFAEDAEYPGLREAMATLDVGSGQ